MRAWGCSRSSSLTDVASVTYTDNFDRLVRPFAIATGVTIPIGAYTFHTTRIGYIAGQQRRVSGEVVFEAGPFYNGDRTSIAVNAARIQVTPQLSVEPSVSISRVDLVQGSFTAKVVRTRTTYTITPRMFVSGLLQYNSASTSVGSNLRFRWEYQPGSDSLSSIQTTTPTRAQTQWRFVTVRSSEVQPAVPALATWASGEFDQQYRPRPRRLDLTDLAMTRRRSARPRD